MTLFVLLATLLGWVSNASAQEYRKITLADGRALTAQVENTLADGMLVRVPQGLIKVPFADVRNLEPVDSDAYASQRSWGIVVLPLKIEGDVSSNDVAALRARLLALTAYLPAVQPALAESRPVPPGKGPVETCGLDSACAARMGVVLGADAVLAGTLSRPAGGGPLQLDLVGTFTATPAATARTTVRTSAPYTAERAALYSAVQTALGLQPDPSRLPAETPEPGPVWGEQTASAATPTTPPTPTPATTPPAETPRGGEAVAQHVAEKPAEPAAPRSPRVVDGAALRKLAWVPVPGLPSMVAGDGKGVALSWTLTVPASAALVNVAGHAAFAKPQFLATSVLGTCLTAVAVNHAVGLRHQVVAAVAPVAGGGAVLQVGVSPASP